MPIKPQTIVQLVKPIAWRGVTFPITHIRTNMEQRLVVHEYPDKDSAHVESTGRKPLVITATAVFYNHLKPYSSEKWQSGDLYPNTFFKFMDACADNSPGVLTHPDLGDLTVKCQFANANLDGNALGGTSVDVAWIETINIKTQSDLSANRLKSQATEMMKELDNSIHRGFDPGTFPSASIFDLMDQIGEFIESVNWLGKRLLNQINKALYHLNKLLNAIDRFNSSIIGGLKMKVLQLRASLEQLLQRAIDLAGKIRKHMVLKDTNLSQLVTVLKSDVRDLLKLNPTAGSRLIIRAGTVILYFAPN